MANFPTFIIHFSLLLITLFFKASNAGNYNVLSFGAKSDGRRESTASFLKAWASACNSATASTIYVPKGKFLINAIVLKGPCKNQITFRIDGTIVAPSDYGALGNSKSWILFSKVNKVSVIGGVLDAKGASYWACRTSGKKCPVGAPSMTFNWANNIVISGLTSINSRQTHLVINGCKKVVVQNVKTIAPDQSPNTDGIHVQTSSDVTIIGCTLQTGDDCVSIGPATYNLFMTNLKCGPGHGVSIGSLGKELNEDGVQNITLKNTIFTGSDNGIRIKTWARPSKGFVRNILFDNIIMNNVENPIVIDQNYCPDNKGCPRQNSGIQISKVTYRNIRGTSATSEAVSFDCSITNPCRDIKLQDIKLLYKNKAATSSCKNVRGSSSGILMPRMSCF
ncbi:polygalacturonase-like [Benincasa hispida]|uniref:polygalacturonase-like n=1 Tax=Benincasa hispida TaxID=102211 RepID=UPI001901017D|nr:polygalacturonase-like [Benincasa hispida]